MRDSNAARSAYRRLLVLYPRDFRERVGSSMEQTFADNLADARGFAFLVWTFAETLLGVIRERIRRQKMSSLVAAGAGVLLVLPLASLEWATRSNLPRTDFALVWFGVLWLLAVLFTRTFMGAVRSSRAMFAGQVSVSNSVALASRLAFLAWSGWVWTMWVIDQMPCFLGASGC